MEKPSTKESILNVAEKLFAQFGFDGASTRNISSEAGVNMAMLNYYFGSKEGLFIAVLERKLLASGSTLRSINQDAISSWEKVEKCIDGYVDRIMADSDFHKMMHRELSLPQRSLVLSSIVEKLSNNIQEVKKIISDGIENGSFNNVDIELMVATLIGTNVYVVNSPHMASIVLGNEIDANLLQSELNPRLKQHFKNIFKAYLIKANA
jgi:AcrR family transcriptional regulator